MVKISHVYIVYNPNSTGDGKANAQAVRRQLKKAGVRATLKATKHAGHAETIAKTIAEKEPAAMIISSSGDGGYHEVVNGVLGSKNPQAVTGVLPSGNANDHFHFIHHGDTVKRICRGAVDSIDVLEVTTPSWKKYAHSYVGLGMTPHIGKELTTQRPNKLQEKWLVLKNMLTIKPVKVRVGDSVRTYTNLVFSNTGRMSKYLTLSNEARLDDGLFEITRVRDGSFAGLLRHLFRATANQIDAAPQAKTYTCTALRNMHVQLDGEIYTILSGETLTVRCLQKMLRCIV